MQYYCVFRRFGNNDLRLRIFSSVIYTGSASHPEAALAIIGDLRRKMYQFLKFRQHKTAFSGIGRAATRPPPDPRV